MAGRRLAGEQHSWRTLGRAVSASKRPWGGQQLVMPQPTEAWLPQLACGHMAASVPWRNSFVCRGDVRKVPRCLQSCALFELVYAFQAQTPLQT